MLKRINATLEKAVSTTGKDKVRRLTKGGHEGEVERY